MAMLQEHSHPSCSSRSSLALGGGHRKSSNESSRRSNTQASAYVVDASTLALTGMHFSSTSGAGGAGWICANRSRLTGGFEVPSAHRPRSPPPSSPCSGHTVQPSLRRGDSSSSRSSSIRSGCSVGDGDAAACHVTEECERLFCETLRAAFLVEKDAGLETSLVTDVQTVHLPKYRHVQNGQMKKQQHHTVIKHDLPTPSTSPDGKIHPVVGTGLVHDYVEVWDYMGGARFRGFVAERQEPISKDSRALFIFFDREVLGKDLKPGLMSLLELASEALDCSRLTICVERDAEQDDVDEVTRSLGWVGFELAMLDDWVRPNSSVVSDRWLFLGMDI